MSIKTVEGFITYPENNYINITHNLTTYPLVQIVFFDQNSFGVIPYGYHGFGDAFVSSPQYEYEYVSNTEIKINFSYKYKNPTNLVKVTDNQYTVNFDRDISATIYLK